MYYVEVLYPIHMRFSGGNNQSVTLDTYTACCKLRQLCNDPYTGRCDSRVQLCLFVKTYRDYCHCTCMLIKLIFICFKEKPFLMLKEFSKDGPPPIGNAKYEGNLRRFAKSGKLKTRTINFDFIEV